MTFDLFRFMNSDAGVTQGSLRRAAKRNTWWLSLVTVRKCSSRCFCCMVLQTRRKVWPMRAVHSVRSAPKVKKPRIYKYFSSKLSTMTLNCCHGNCIWRYTTTCLVCCNSCRHDIAKGLQDNLENFTIKACLAANRHDGHTSASNPFSIWGIIPVTRS